MISKKKLNEIPNIERLPNWHLLMTHTFVDDPESMKDAGRSQTYV